MTTARKAVLIVATVLLVGGSALALGAFAAADFRFENLSNTTRDWVSDTRILEPEAEAPHTAIVVRDAGGDVRFEQADGDAFEVTCWTSSEKTVDVVDEGGVLEITGHGTSLTGLMIMKVEFQDHATVVKVPRSYTGSLTVETGSGSIDVADLDGLEAVSLTASSGSLSVLRTSAGTMSLKTSSGSIGVVGVDAEGFSARTSSGSLSLGDVEAATVETGTASGRQDLSDVRATTLDIRGSSGSIGGAGLDANETMIEATSGRVDVMFANPATDYDIAVSSTSGRVDAPSGTIGVGKRIVVRTTSGSIDLDFNVEAAPDSAGRGNDGASSDGSSPSAPGAPAAPAAPAAP